MKNISILAIIILLAPVIYAQKEEISVTPIANYSLEIWNVEVQSKDGFNYIEIDVFNKGDDYPEPSIQVIHNETYIVNPENKYQESKLPSNNLHKFEFPIELPSNHNGKKIKLEINISNKEHSMSKKFKVKVTP